MKVSRKLILALSCCCVLTLALTGCSMFECKHKETTIEKQTAATCLNPGYTGDTVCVECGEVVKAGLTQDALEHKTSVSNSKEATCKEEGFTGDAICEVCGTTVIPGEVIAVIEHDGEEINKKEPTCQEPGYSGDMKCKLCGEIYKKGVVQEAVDHDWVEIKVQQEATCKQDGKHTVECRFCKATMDEKIPKLEHQIVTDPSVEATCTTAGKTEGKRCAVCKTVIQEQKIIKALGHDVVTTAKGVDATCTKDGKASVSRCQRCNEQLTNGEVIKASGHKETKTAAVAATCTTPGKTEGSVCSVCKTVIKEATSVSALGHKNTPNTDVPATCETPGKSGGTYCSVCKTVTSEVKEIPAKGHKTKIEGAKEASCTEEGYTGDEVCETCGKVIKEGTVIEKAEHKIKDVGNAVPPSCTAEGRSSDKICTECETVVEPGQTIPMLEHKYVEQDGTRQESTCTEYGHENNFVCSTCGDVKEGEQIAKQPHTRIEDPTTAIEATCQERGKRADVICEVCKKTLSRGRATNKVDCEGISADDAVESTCTTAGHTASTICKWCETKLTEGEVLPLLPHTTAERGAVAPTCSEKGKTAEIYCTVCNTVVTESEDIDTVPHTPVKTSSDVPATCIAEGKIAGTKCDVCDAPLTEDEILPMLPHDFTNKAKCIAITMTDDTHTTVKVEMSCNNCIATQEFVGTVSNVNINKTPTCTEVGSLTCTITAKINDTVTHVWENAEFEMPKQDHETQTVPGLAPTCVNDGYTESINCVNCSYVEKEKETIPARHVLYTINNYTWDETEDADGCHATLFCVCTDCEEEFTLRVKILSEISREDATCVADGRVLYETKVNSDKFTEDYVELEKKLPAKLHKVSNFPNYDTAEGEAPNYDLKTGKVYCTLTCDECQENFEHVFIGKAEISKEPTCEERGELHITWAVDEEAIRVAGGAHNGETYRFLSAEGHLYDNEETPDICTRCNTHKALANAWWKGSVSQGYIAVSSVTIQKEIPEEGTYKESWNADRDDAGYIKAFLIDEQTLILSTMGADELYLNVNGHFLEGFACLTTINGLELVNISNCESLTNTFAGCAALTAIDISTWATEKETLALHNTFKDCAELVTITADKALVYKIVAPELSEDEVDETFLGCVALRGVVATDDGPIVTAYRADMIGALSATEYFSYSIISADVGSDT